MIINTFNYHSKKGWSVKAFPKLDSKKTLVIVFGASDYLKKPKPIKELIDAYPHSHIVGCSSSGEIFETEINDDSLSVAVAQFKNASIKVASMPIDHSKNSFSIGSKLAKKLAAPKLKNIIVLSDGLNVNGTELINGLLSKTDNSVIITGGLAGDADRFEKTWVLNQDKIPKSNVVTAIGLYGDKLEIGYGTKAGWDIFGPERIITKSEGNVLYEIDGHPALELYKKYLGDRASDLPAAALLFPLAIRETSDTDVKLIRTILAIDEKTQSMRFAGDVPQGWHTQLMRANFDGLIEGASAAGEMANIIAKNTVNKNTLTLAISCVGRRLILGERAEEEIEAVLEKLPKLTKLIGFYSYGEICPTGLTSCELHNQTMTVTTISEKER